MKLLYDDDFYVWTQQTAELLRQARLNEVDAEHLAEEISDMGNRDRREVHNRLRVLLTHLLKWQIQPGYRGPSWTATINEQRDQLELVLADSPSLRRYAEEQLDSVYPKALKKALVETGLEPRMPESCPYSIDQILDPTFMP
jgi:hypothetical protein